MNRLTDLLNDVGRCISELQYDYSNFWTKSKTFEMCPNCLEEIEITMDGLTSCKVCGHKEVLPCNACPLEEIGSCDWNKNTRCSPFPINRNKGVTK